MVIRALLAKLARPRPRLEFHWITPEWAVGAAPSPDSLSWVARAGIAGVLDLRAEAVLRQDDYARLGLDLLHLPVVDQQAPDYGQLQQGVQWVADRLAAGDKVLICCHAGRGRSVTFGAAVLVSQGYPLSEAFALIARCRLTQVTDSQLAVLESYAAATASARRDAAP